VKWKSEWWKNTCQEEVRRFLLTKWGKKLIPREKGVLKSKGKGCREKGLQMHGSQKKTWRCSMTPDGEITQERNMAGRVAMDRTKKVGEKIGTARTQREGRKILAARSMVRTKQI